MLYPSSGETPWPPRFIASILPVTDIDEAARFYAAVLGESGERVSSGRHYFGANGSGAILACYDPKTDGDKVGDWLQHENQYVYFSVDDLEAAHRAVTGAGAMQITKIKPMPWGETMFYAKDPFGNPISFVKTGTEFLGG